jgi:hypothetical protein
MVTKDFCQSAGVAKQGCKLIARHSLEGPIRGRKDRNGAVAAEQLFQACSADRRAERLKSRNRRTRLGQ